MNADIEQIKLLNTIKLLLQQILEELKKANAPKP
jgi:hypothetical protein